MSHTRPLSPAMLRILRAIPEAGDDSVSPFEAGARAGIGTLYAQQLLHRAAKSGLVVRIRPGAYQLPRRRTRH